MNEKYSLRYKEADQKWTEPAQPKSCLALQSWSHWGPCIGSMFGLNFLKVHSIHSTKLERNEWL